MIKAIYALYRIGRYSNTLQIQLNSLNIYILLTICSAFMVSPAFPITFPTNSAGHSISLFSSDKFLSWYKTKSIISLAFSNYSRLPVTLTYSSKILL